MKHESNNTRQDFLLSFFSGEGNEEKELNGYWLLKRQNGNTGKWYVAIYTKESYTNHKNFLNQPTLLKN